MEFPLGTGAISKEKGAKIAALANIPSILIWGVSIYLFLFETVEMEASTGFLVIFIIAIPLTTYIAYLSGGFGEVIQRQEFPENTVLGIKGYHWVWAVFPVSSYSTGIVFVATKYVGLQLATWSDTSIFATLLSLLMLVPIVAWVYPLRIVHRVLMGDLLSNYSAAIRGLANILVIAANATCLRDRHSTLYVVAGRRQAQGESARYRDWSEAAS